MHSRAPVTLADIAEVAQVSISTVSRILKHRDGSIKISQATQERVLEVAKQLGYEPNPFASALRTQRTGVLGVIIRDIGDPFLSLLVRMLQREVRKAGFEVLIGHAEYDYETAQSQAQLMVSHWFDGLFLLGNVPGDHSLLQTLELRRTPFVALACGAQLAAPFVTVDDKQGMALALDYLYHLGHRRIAFLGDIVHAGVRDRLSYFTQFMQERAIWNEAYVHTQSSSRSAAATYVHHLLNLAEPPTALFCASDILALGAFASAWQHGQRVPQDLSIIGFDDIEEAAELYPPLTTIRQPVEIMAREGFSLLRALIDETLIEDAHRHTIVPAELIQRASCAPPLEKSRKSD